MTIIAIASKIHRKGKETHQPNWAIKLDDRMIWRMICIRSSIKIEDRFYPHFKALIDSLVESKQVAYVEKSNYEPQAIYPKDVVLNTVAAVREKVLEAEENVQNSCYVEQDVFWENIDRRMKKHED